MKEDEKILSHFVHVFNLLVADLPEDSGLSLLHDALYAR